MTASALNQLPTERQRRLLPGLKLLEEAAADAAGLGHDPWQFAPRLAELHAVGLTTGDVRWLISRGLVHHAIELSRPNSAVRKFSPSGNLMLGETSCLLLDSSAIGYDGPTTLPISVPPRWDPERRELHRGGLLIKQYRVPAPSQEAILSAFEEEGWPARVDDPLPADWKSDSAQRLHDAVRGLNRNQRHQLIRFHRDGRGEGICWSSLVHPTEIATAAMA